MFVYRPHVHGLDAVTTPDLILDMDGLSSAVQWRGGKRSVAAAWVFVAAHYGPLVTVGLLDGDTPWLIARSAWRLAEAQSLEIFLGGSGAVLDGETPRPATGEARFVRAPLPALPAPASCEVRLHDRQRQRSIVHRVQFLEIPA